MVDCSLVGVALVELFVLAHRASWDLLSLVLLPAVLESSAVLLLCAHRRGMALQLVSQLVGCRRREVSPQALFLAKKVRKRVWRGSSKSRRGSGVEAVPTHQIKPCKLS